MTIFSLPDSNIICYPLSYEYDDYMNNNKNIVIIIILTMLL